MKSGEHPGLHGNRPGMLSTAGDTAPGGGKGMKWSGVGRMRGDKVGRKVDKAQEESRFGSISIC